jgi:hypothetical protein
MGVGQVAARGPRTATGDGTDADSYHRTYAAANTNGSTNTQPGAYAYAHTHTDAHTDAHTDTHTDTHTDAHTHANANGNEYQRASCRSLSPKPDHA